MLLFLINCYLTATDVYAHTPSVPVDQQPSMSGGSLSNCQKALWQHLCFPVSEVKDFFFSWNFHIITYTVYRAWSMLSRSYFSSFSGSHIENWHSILRNGLVNASYTKLQVEYINSKCLLSLITVWSYRQFQHRKFLCGCSDHRNLSLLSILAPWCCVWERHLFESHFKHIIWIFW